MRAAEVIGMVLGRITQRPATLEELSQELIARPAAEIQAAIDWLWTSGFLSRTIGDNPKYSISPRQPVDGRKEQKHGHYFRDVSHLQVIDPYRIYDLYEVTDGTMQHIIKKAMCTGKRGDKDFRRDVQDIADTANRKLQMMDEDEKA